MSARIELHPSYILHTRPYRDTSLLVDTITQGYGKVSLIARGARKAKNNQRYLLQPFMPLLLSWQGKGALKTLTGVEPQGLASSLAGVRLYSAMYANELLSYLLVQDDPTMTMYEDYQVLLDELCESECLIEPCLRRFELHLLEELGYGINFIDDADTAEPIVADQHYFFIANHGFVATGRRPDIRDVSYTGRSLLNIAKYTFDDSDTRRAAKQLLRGALKPYLRGRKLKSRELFATLVPPISNDSSLS